MKREQLLSFEKDTRTIEDFFNTTEVQDIISQNKKERKYYSLFLLFLTSFLIILFNFDLLPLFVLTLIILSTPFLPAILIFYIGSYERRFIKIYQLQEIFKNKYGIYLSNKDIKHKFNNEKYTKIYFYDLYEKNNFIDVFDLSNNVMTKVSHDVPEMAILFFSERQKYCCKQRRTEVENCILQMQNNIKNNCISEQKIIDLLKDLKQQCVNYRLLLLEKYNNGCSRQEIY